MQTDLPLRPTIIKYGFALGTALVAHSLIIFYSKTPPDEMSSFVSQAIVSIVLFMGIREYKQKNDSYLSWKQGFRLGVWASTLAGVMLGIYAYIETAYFDRTSLEQLIKIAEEQIKQTVGVPEESKQLQISIYRNYIFTPIGLFFATIINYAVIGFITTALIMLFQRNTRPLNT